MRKINYILPVAAFLVLVVIGGLLAKYDTPVVQKASSASPSPTIISELNLDQTARLNTALAELQATQNNIDRLVLQIFSELKVDYREVELKPAGQGKWQIVKKVDSKIGSTLATPTPTATASPTPQSK